VIALRSQSARRGVTPTGVPSGLVALFVFAGYGLALGIGSLLFR
jgi:hypothetical protein